MMFLRLARTHALIIARQRALWVASLALVVIAVLSTLGSGLACMSSDVADLINLTRVLMLLPPIAYAAAFTDLASAPARLGIGEIENTAIVRPATLAVARVVGSLSVMVLPSAVLLLASGVGQTLQGNMWAIPQSIILFVAVVLPVSLLATAVSACAGAIFPRAMARIAAVVAWCVTLVLMWGVWAPGFAGTMKFHIADDPFLQAFFGTGPLLDSAQDTGQCYTPVEAIMWLVAKFALAFVLLVVASAIARKRSYRRG